mmetsp:Transcript_57554/g.95172  ORF Transcript_57554/g.95172 Transcript_57554/m.95172 type:complete len:205 (+) Transcript_57554:250-864(+)
MSMARKLNSLHVTLPNHRKPSLTVFPTRFARSCLSITFRATPSSAQRSHGTKRQRRLSGKNYARPETFTSASTRGGTQCETKLSIRRTSWWMALHPQARQSTGWQSLPTSFAYHDGAKICRHTSVTTLSSFYPSQGAMRSSLSCETAYEISLSHAQPSRGAYLSLPKGKTRLMSRNMMPSMNLLRSGQRSITSCMCGLMLSRTT